MIPLRILFQDEFLVAIDKPAGMLVHPSGDSDGPEWIAMKRLRDQLGRRVFPIHRLDRPTSGALLFALDRKTAALAQQLFERREVSKIYQAIVCGITPETWICDTPLSPSSDDEALPAQTEFTRMGTTSAGDLSEEATLWLSLLQVKPTTGRFHQIRRHLLESGFPIIGDFRYAGQELSFLHGKILGTGTRMLLQAKTLDFTHPHTGQALHIEAPIDEDFLKCFPQGS